MRDVDELTASHKGHKKTRWSALRRVRLVSALGRLGDPKAVEPLSRVVLADPSPAVRIMAVFALGQVGDPAGAPALRREVSARFAVDQRIAIQALGRIRDRESVPLLIERLKSRDGDVRVTAAIALGDIGERTSTLPLIEALADPYVRPAAAAALARLGDPLALEPVRLAYGSADGLAHRRIGRALAKLEASFEDHGESEGAPRPKRARALPALVFERWILPSVLMCAALWDAIKIRSKKQRLAEAIEQGRRLFSARDRQRAYEREAYEFLKRTVWEFPEDPEIRVLYATMCLEFRPDDVVPEATRAVELGQDNPSILVRAGSLLLNRGDRKSAQWCVDRASEIAPPDFALAGGLENLVGLLAALRGEDDLAEEKLRGAVSKEPDNEPFVRNLAVFLAERGRLQEGAEVLEEALKHTENKVDLERMRARMAREVGF